MGADMSSSSSQGSSVWGGNTDQLGSLFQQGSDLLSGFTPQTQIPGQATEAWGQQLQPQGNPYLDQMESQYSNYLGQQNQATGGEAGLTGGYGGGRQGVAEHLNTQEYANNVGNFLGGQYQGDMDRANSALGMTDQMMATDPYNQQAGALSNYAGLLGGPTVLGGGSSSSGFGVGAK